ncbi:T9SS type A sorting domain-containing protein [Flavobacterium sp. MAH-1]|uniref:Aminopeptidase N n=1 Tax=Flavobacterium agri TaxID=2743471 RepID=A0A7Y8Y0S7_9FLAO|nr:M1 family aminopeptidase [Flavobacterium agri]NUY80286.1 T9SS type A sorting domain-containing protein [Flavobacterium agri]NYA70311.1 T9SS type A sorting domain-containing protein [Flavobacterium agri]
MKKLYFLATLFAVSVFGQNPVNGIAKIAESEMKSAESLLSVQINPNTTNYDITYHKLEFTVDPADYFITGKVTTTYTALSNMSNIHFDLTNSLTVSSVKLGTTNLTFNQTALELVVTLPSVQTAGTSATLEINYSGEPSFGEQAFTTTTHNGTPALFTLSEPFGARDWWPCKQDLNDKVNSVDIFITAPSQYVSVANGLEVGQTTSGSNKTTHFHHNYPIPAYLIAIAVTNYSVFTLNAGTAPNEFPIVNYVYPENLEDAQDGFGQTPAIMDLYEELFETYPFSDEKYGHAQFGWGGGMEHTTVSFMAGFWRELVAHELGHQWFGDKVTCGSWKDIWLNEGFATYLAALVIEHFDGVPDFINWKGDVINDITSSPNGAVYLTDFEATNVNRIFSSRLSYNKGAMVLEMLRWKLGDVNFYQALRNYLADPDHAYKYAVTTDLQSHFEAVSGENLDEFFDDWIFKQGYPTYSITASNWSGGICHLTVNQTQSNPSVSFFEMPVPVRVFGAGGQQMDLVLNNTSNGQTFNMPVPFTVTSIQFDPDKHIISRDSNASLGVGSFTTLAGANIYPNPTRDILNVNLPLNVNLQKVIVTNPLGQHVLETTQDKVNVSALASGVHFVTVYTDGGERTFKFVKE